MNLQNYNNSIVFDNKFIYLIHSWINKSRIKNHHFKDFPGSPVVKSVVPMQGVRVRSLVGEQGPTFHVVSRINK